MGKRSQHRDGGRGAADPPLKCTPTPTPGSGDPQTHSSASPTWSSGDAFAFGPKALSQELLIDTAGQGRRSAGQIPALRVPDWEIPFLPPKMCFFPAPFHPKAAPPDLFLPKSLAFSPQNGTSYPFLTQQLHSSPYFTPKTASPAPFPPQNGVFCPIFTPIPALP